MSVLPDRGVSTRSRMDSRSNKVITVPVDPSSFDARHQFDEWLAERAELQAILDVTPGSDERTREKIFDRYFTVEQLILNTPCLDLPAVRAKVAVVLSYMEMERADGLQAMRHIKAYFGEIN